MIFMRWWHIGALWAAGVMLAWFVVRRNLVVPSLQATGEDVVVVGSAIQLPSSVWLFLLLLISTLAVVTTLWFRARQKGIR